MKLSSRTAQDTGSNARSPRMAKPRVAAMLVSLALLLAFAGSLHAANFVWTGAVSSNWNVAGNWLDSLAQPGVPQNGDNVTVNNPNPANPCILPPPGSKSGNDWQLVNFNINNGATVFGGLGANAGRLRLTGNFFVQGSTFTAQNGTLVFAGTAAQTITGSSQRMGNLTISNTSTAGVVFNGSWVIGDPNFPQLLTVSSGSRIRFQAAVNLTNTDVANSGVIRFEPSSQQNIITITGKTGINLGNVEFVASNPTSTGIGIVVNNPIGFRNLDMTGLGGVQFNNAVTLTGNMTDALGGVLTFFSVISTQTYATLTFAGTTPQTVTLGATTADQRLSAYQIIVAADADVTLNGKFRAEAKGSLTPAVLVDRPGSGAGSQGGKLTMTADTVIRIGDGTNDPGESVIRIDGRLTSTVGAGATRPRFIGGPAPSNRARVIFGQTSFADLDGFVFERIGSNASAYGMIISDGATIELFDNVSVLQSNAVTAIIDLNTGNLPTKEFFEGLEVEAAAGGAPRNIDANNVSGFVLQITSGGNSGGNRYGIAFEVDNNNVLAWDSAPALSIANSSPLNPPATGDRPYQFNILAQGGNAPYTFTSTANPPQILVTQIQAPNPPFPIPVLYLDAITGVVSTDPLFRAVNPTGFPGDPGYDPNQEPVRMPLQNVGGVYDVTVICTDSSRPARVVNQVLRFSVQSPPQPVPQVNTFALPDGFEGADYPSGVVISAINSTPTIAYPGGNPGFVFSISPASPDGLPTGLTLNALSGAITGLVQFGAAGGSPSRLYEIDFRVTDINGNSDDQRIDIRVFEGVPLLQLASGPPSQAVEGIAYSFKLNAIGGKTPYSWDLTGASGPLPEGLFLAGNGQISGTPGPGTSTATPPGIYPVIFRVTDNLGTQVSQPATLVVLAPPPPIVTLTPERAGGGGCAIESGSSTGWAILALGGLAMVAISVSQRRRRHAFARAKHTS